MPTFDVVSEVDHHELQNAIDQTQREIDNRFDFKGTAAKISLDKLQITMLGESDFQIDQIIEVLRNKLSKRSIDVQSLKLDDPMSYQAKRQRTATILEGIDTELGKKIIKDIKAKKLKVQASIQGDQVRVSGKKRDDLQDCISVLKEHNYSQPLQFNNFRD